MLVGPPCRSINCGGVLVMMFDIRSKEMFYECHMCHATFDREPAANKLAQSISTIRQALGGGIEGLDS